MTKIAFVSATDANADGQTWFEVPNSLIAAAWPDQVANLLQTDSNVAVGSLTGDTTIEQMDSGVWQVNWSWT